jgi:hypothetical protein
MSEHPPQQLSRSKRLLFALLTLLVGLAVGLVVLEIGLRIAGYSSPEFYEADEKLGYRLIPGMSGWYTREGRSYVEINSDGFRDLEHAVAKPEGTYRVAVIGDSYVEALQVGRDETFANYIPTAMANCPNLDGRRVEVLTFGVSGYSTAQELLMLRAKVWKYSPDMVLLAVTTNNDITDNSRYFKKTPIPYYEVRDGQLTLDDSFLSDRVFVRRNSSLTRLGTWLMDHLRFVQAYTDVHRRVKYELAKWREAGNSPPADAGGGTTPEVGSEPGIDNQIYREPSDENWRAAWDVTERLIGVMDAETREHGAKFVVVLTSNGIQVVPSREQRVAFAKRLGVDDLNYPNRRLVGYCNSHSIAAIDLVPELTKFADESHVYLHGFDQDIGNGHWNRVGHKIAGEAIGRHLCEIFQ